MYPVIFVIILYNRSPHWRYRRSGSARSGSLRVTPLTTRGCASCPFFTSTMTGIPIEDLIASLNSTNIGTEARELANLQVASRHAFFPTVSYTTFHPGSASASFTSSCPRNPLPHLSRPEHVLPQRGTHQHPDRTNPFWAKLGPVFGHEQWAATAQ